MNVTFNRNGWFASFYKFSVGLFQHEEPTSNGCAFFWTSLFSIILIPFTWWNYFTEMVIDDRAKSLGSRAGVGILCYIGYGLLILIGHELYVSNVDEDGNLSGYFINLIQEDNLNLWWELLFLPVLALISVIIILTILGLFIYGCVSAYEIIEDKMNPEYGEWVDVRNDNGIVVDRKYVKKTKTNVLISTKNLLISIKEKYCPVIEWK